MKRKSRKRKQPKYEMRALSLKHKLYPDEKADFRLPSNASDYLDSWKYGFSESYAYDVSVSKAIQNFIHRKPIDSVKFLKTKKRKSKSIDILYSLFSPTEGMTVIPITYQHKNSMTKSEWKNKIERYYQKVYTRRIIPAYNVRHDKDYKYDSIIAWKF